MYCGVNGNEAFSRHYAVVTIIQEDHKITTSRDHKEHEYETIPEVQETGHKNKASSDHQYDDTINRKYDNVLPDKSGQCHTSNAKYKSHTNQSNAYDDTVNVKYDNALPDKSGYCRTLNSKTEASVDQSKPTSSTNKAAVTVAEEKNDTTNDKQPCRSPPKPIIESIHKDLPLKKQPNLMSSITKSTAPIADTHGTLSPGSHPTPKPIIQSIHEELFLRKKSAGKNETHSINQSKPMSSITKPIATVVKTHSDSSTGKSPPPKPIQSIHKDLPLRKQSNEKKVSHVRCINQSKPVLSTSKPTPTITETHSDPPTGKHPPPKPMIQSIHKDLLLKKRYASLDVATRDAVGKYQKPNIQSPLPPKPVAYSNTTAASHQAVDQHPKPPPLPPKHVK